MEEVESGIQEESKSDSAGSDTKVNNNNNNNNNMVINDEEEKIDWNELIKPNSNIGKPESLSGETEGDEVCQIECYEL